MNVFPGVMYAAWGLSNGQFTPRSLAQLALDHGFYAVALEYDDFGNAGRWADFRDRLREKGVLPGVWFTDGWMTPFCPPDAGFLVVEVESDSDCDGLVDSLHLLDSMPKAVITNFGGLLVKKADGTTDKEATKARCAPIVNAGFHCQYEAYFMSEPDNTDAAWCGWPGDMVAPVLGVGFNGKTLEQQKALQTNGYGLYLAEYLTP